MHNLSHPRRTFVLAAALIAALAAFVAPPATANHRQPFDGTQHDYGELVDYPLVFPVLPDSLNGETVTYRDTFHASRGGGEHHAQDLMAPKMTKVLAAASGTVRYVNFSGNNCCSLVIEHDDGWETWYIHLNNDTPGTDDGIGYGIVAGIERGTHVAAGQHIGWVGDSGNAEWTAPHLHFELYDPEDVLVNPYQTLRAAEGEGVMCAGRLATIVGTNADDIIAGTSGDDVIAAGGGNDVVHAGGGDDVVCGGPGNDLLEGGLGNDRLEGGAGRDMLVGGEASARASGVDDDHLLGGPGDDRLQGGGGRDILRGAQGDDVILAGNGNDELFGGPGSDDLAGGRGDDILHAGAGDDSYGGGPGRDLVAFDSAPAGVTVNLRAGTASGQGADTIAGVEGVLGSRHADRIIGDHRPNRIRGGGAGDVLDGGSGRDRITGGGGDDLIRGHFGDDHLDGGAGADWIDGGAGSDRCKGETTTRCEI